MEDKNKIAIQMIGWYLILILVPIIGVLLEWVQQMDIPVSIAALLLASISGLGVLINRLIKLYFALEGDNPLATST
jgi:hypothetical protein